MTNLWGLAMRIFLFFPSFRKFSSKTLKKTRQLQEIVIRPILWTGGGCLSQQVSNGLY